jgi:Domain of unknown function (DUF4149)
MMGMLVLRFAAVLAIAVWIGGLLALGAIVAPAIFDVATARGATDGRLLAGAVFGETLRRFHLAAYGCGAIVLLLLIVRALLGPRPRLFALRLATATAMLGATLYSGFVVSPGITRVQQEIGAEVAVSSLPASDPRRVEFGRLHQLSTLIQLAPLIGGCVLLFFELSDA